LLRPFMMVPADQYLFSASVAEDRRNARRRQLRVTPMTPSQARRARRRDPRRRKRDSYDVHSYRRAIARGIERAARERRDVGHWSPNRLRHTRATEIRRQYGIEGAQVSLGHARADTTQLYAERDLNLAISIAARTG
jgi:hypothetical protein